ncbi:MAG TPA: tRNA dihydrouridine synthase DusB [Alphaproteobacteria bacterium]|nr:tRNA dihydrouridine synthase DusB [Alphaproteobacteria bacterium]
MTNHSKLPHFRSKVFLAPMAGISDSAFRTLCHENGAGLTVTELTSVHAITHPGRSKHLINEFGKLSDYDHPRGIQLFGNDVDVICEAAKIVEPYFDIIDFNMGCPAPHITQQMAGAALLDKPDHVEKMFSKLVGAVNKPVTLKVRAGIGNDNCYLYKPIAKIAENCGVSMIALHARTLKQGYSGHSNWALIKELKDHVNIPVVGNGDVKSPEDYDRMLKETGCDYVMIGRAAMGNPLIFRQIDNFVRTGEYKPVAQKEQIEQFFKYIDNAQKYEINFASIKVQAMQFTHGVVGAPKLRGLISSTKNNEEIIDVFRKFYEELQ